MNGDLLRAAILRRLANLQRLNDAGEIARPTRRVFISYHHRDQAEVEEFINAFDHERKVFTYRAVGVGMEPDIINSTNTDYVMRRIRELYLKDSTVTIVLIGRCTWARRYVDWEIQASLRGVGSQLPNGLIGIVLPSAGRKPILPHRLQLNIKGSNGDEGYACCYWYPTRVDTLSNWIEDAFQARTKRAHLIVNPRERFSNNRPCP